MEYSDLRKSQMLMELFTVVIQIFILCDWIADTGIQIQESQSPEIVFQRFIQFSSVSASLCIVIQINAQFTAVGICRTAVEGTCIGIALNHTILFKNKIWKAFQCAGDPVPEFR